MGRVGGAMEFDIFTLSNGIRIIHKQTSGEVSHCGIIINAGSRDEQENEQGIAHLIEHVLFKGTKKRKAYHVLSRIDAVGGELNAYTTKEETCVYASFQNVYYERAVELLSDICFHSVFPEKEIDKEKEVITDEINSYQDNPSEQIFDDFEEHLFPHHSLGRNILGNVNSLRKLKRKDIIKFIKRNYHPDQIVFSSIGNIALSEVKKIIEKYFQHLPHSKSKNQRTPIKNYKPFQREVKRDTYQSHCIIGNIAYGAKNKNRTAMVLLNNLLGGPGMNSRLNLSIREKFGFTYNLESNYISYSDTGVFVIYLGTDNGYMAKCMDLVYKELNKLKNKKLSAHQLQSAKRQLIGNISLAQESKISLMLAVGRSLLTFNKIDSLQQLYKKIEAITPEKILEIANEVFDDKQLSKLIYLSK